MGKELRLAGCLYREIARQFGVSNALCRYIVTARKREHVWGFRLHA